MGGSPAKVQFGTGAARVRDEITKYADHVVQG